MGKTKPKWGGLGAADAALDTALLAGVVLIPVLLGKLDFDRMAVAIHRQGFREMALAGLLVVVSLAVHEAGHCYEARRAGISVKHIGIGLARGWLPGLYCQFNGSLRELDSLARLRVDLAGPVWQSAFGTATCVIGIAANTDAGIAAGVSVWIVAFWQLLPLPEHDGYWTLINLVSGTRFAKRASSSASSSARSGSDVEE